MTKHEALFERACQTIPGGVNSPVRAFGAVGGAPIFFKSGQGAYLTSEENTHYIDYVCSWGAMILGHAHPAVVKSVQQFAQSGLGFGAPTVIELQLAELIREYMPNMEQCRMVNSGTEAGMTAIRLARGFTQRNKIIKFIGGYHGHSDSLLAKAGSGLLTLAIPNTPGIPPSVTEHTLLAPFNDLIAVGELFNRWGEDIAAVIVEPVAGNMGCIPPVSEFLPGLRRLCDKHDSLLIFDEVITGFRVGRGGAQERYHVKPDLTLLGKIMGGGLPAAALGGRTNIMDHLAPQGPVYQAGTLSGNPIAMAAGYATLLELGKVDFHVQLEKRTQQLISGIEERAQRHGIPLVTQQVGGLFSLFFTEDTAPITDYQQVSHVDQERFRQFFHGMLAQGIYIAPSPFECGFLSSAHKDEEIQLTLDAVDKVLAQL